MKTLKKYKWNIIALACSAILIAITFHIPESHPSMDYLEFIGGMGIGTAMYGVFKKLYHDKKKQKTKTL